MLRPRIATTEPLLAACVWVLLESAIHRTEEAAQQGNQIESRSVDRYRRRSLRWEGACLESMFEMDSVGLRTSKQSLTS